MATFPKYYKRIIYRQRSFSTYYLLILLFISALLVGLSTPQQIRTSLFQSPISENRGGDSGDDSTPLPASWLFSAGGELREFGAVKVQFPPRFTDQGGANVFGDVLIKPLLIKNEKLIIGTQFALGIWPPNDQTDFQQPIGIRITLDATKVNKGSENFLVIMMYDPHTQQWKEQKSEFNKDTFEITTTIQTFTPVPKDFDMWGGRTFFGVFQRTPIALTVPTSSPSPTSTPTSSPSSILPNTPTPTQTNTPSVTPTQTSTPDLVATEVAVQKAAIATLTAEAQIAEVDTMPLVTVTVTPPSISEDTSGSCTVPFGVVGVIFMVMPLALRQTKKNNITRKV